MMRKSDGSRLSLGRRGNNGSVTIGTSRGRSSGGWQVSQRGEAATEVGTEGLGEGGEGKGERQVGEGETRGCTALRTGWRNRGRTKTWKKSRKVSAQKECPWVPK